MNPYIELGVKPGVNLKELKQAYRQSVLRYHPDTALGDGNPEKFHRVAEAYELLKDLGKEKVADSDSIASEKTESCEKEFSANQQKAWWQESVATSTKTWWKKEEDAQDNPQNEKGCIDQQTAQLSLAELINCVEFSENKYVRQVAMEAIAIKREEDGVDYLIDLLKKSETKSRPHVIQALGQRGLQRVDKVLIPFVMDESIEVSTSAIKSLERIDSANRTLVVEYLRKETSSWQDNLVQPLSKFKNWILGAPATGGMLGDLLLRTKKLTQEQLEVSLLVQKRFPLLLGQILRHLEYMAIPDIQQAINLQKNFRYY